jgi:hypothetical protein
MGFKNLRDVFVLGDHSGMGRETQRSQNSAGSDLASILRADKNKR